MHEGQQNCSDDLRLVVGTVEDIILPLRLHYSTTCGSVLCGFYPLYITLFPRATRPLWIPAPAVELRVHAARPARYENSGGHILCPINAGRVR